MSTPNPMTTRDTTTSDRILAIVMATVGVGAIVASSEISAMASVFPSTIAALLLLFSLILLAKTFKVRSHTVRPEGGSVARRLALVGIILAWAFALNPLGFLASSLLGTIALTVVAHFHDWNTKRAFIYGLSLLAIIGFFYSLFALVLDVPLPDGTLWRNL